MSKLGRALILALFIAAPAAAQQTQTLTVGRTIDRTLAAGEAHSYPLTLQASRFVSGVAVQDGIDLEVMVIGPQGDTLHRFDSPNGRDGPEHFQITTSVAGAYRLVIAPLATESGRGRYTLTLQQMVAAATTPAGKVDQAMSRIAADAPGVAVAVVRGGNIVYQKAWGLANLTHQIPFTVNALNNIGSTSKQFTAFAILLLAADNKLSLDDDVRKHVPELPDLGQPVTIRHLLTHTSGYREFLNTLALTGRRLDYGDYVARNEIIDMLKRQPALQNAPGSEHNYNNSGYALLATIVERASGKDFPVFMQERVFKPLGMTHTLVRATPGQVVANATQGYVRMGAGFREAQDIGASMGAGGIYTTLADLTKWMRNFKTEAVGPKDFFQQMTTRAVLTKGDTINYGFGLVIDKWRGLRRVQHGGADIAHRSAFVYFPELDAGVIVQSNNGEVSVDAHAGTAAAAFFGDRLAPADAKPPALANAGAALDTTRFDAYAGQYALAEAPGFVLTFSRRGDKYYTQATGQREVELQPTSDSTFAVTGVAAIVTFHREPDGSVKRLTLNQNGLHPANRIDSKAAVSKVDLQDYVGRYFSDELETFYDLTVVQDTLMLRHRRTEPVKLRHARGDDFTGSFPVASIVFIRDPSGKVTGLKAGNGRTRDVVFKRVD